MRIPSRRGISFAVRFLSVASANDAGDIERALPINGGVVKGESICGGGARTEERIRWGAFFTSSDGAVQSSTRPLRILANAAFAASCWASVALLPKVDGAAGFEAISIVGAHHRDGIALDIADIHGS